MLDVVQYTNYEVLVFTGCAFAIGIIAGRVLMIGNLIELESMRRNVDMGHTFTDRHGRIWSTKGSFRWNSNKECKPMAVRDLPGGES